MNKNILFFSLLFIFLLLIIFNLPPPKETNEINSNNFSYFNFSNTDELEKKYKEYIKNIDFEKSKEVNGLKVFVKPMKKSLTDTIYTKESFFQTSSLFDETKQEKLEKIKKEESRKKINLHHLEIIEIIKNVSNKVIYFCSCYLNGGYFGVYRSINALKAEHLMPFFPVEGIAFEQPYETERIKKMLPGQISINTYNLKHLKGFKKGNQYSIFTRYNVSSLRYHVDTSKVSPITFAPSINGKIVSSKEITLPVWEGELQSNALTVVVR